MPEARVALDSITKGQDIRPNAAGIFLIAVRVMRHYLLECENFRQISTCLLCQRTKEIKICEYQLSRTEISD
jgi:hypothetical protein